MFEIFVTIITVLYVVVCLFMILVILLQAGRGGMGTALGGGASQSVFGGGGSSDVLAKVTQYCAMSFMVFAMFLAYAGSHSGSARLQEKSEENEVQEIDQSGEINWEAIGPGPVNLAQYVKAEESSIDTPPPVFEAPTDAGNPPAEPDAATGNPGEPSGDAAPTDAAPTDAAAAAAPTDAKAEAPADAKAP